MIARFREVPPDALTVTTGTQISGTLGSTQIWQDGNYLKMTEVAGDPGLDITFTFEGVDEMLYILMIIWYDGGATHDIQTQLYDYTNTTWVNFWGQHLTCCLQQRMLPILKQDDYISSGQVKVRFLHPSNGNINHDFYVFYMGVLY